MDKERAKFILESFRPDGADAEDADFAEALRFATSDRELGNWLMRERAFDAEFAEALARVHLPEGLREKVLLGMVQDSADAPRVDLKREAEMMQAMAGIEVPGGLRERILVSMEQTAKSRVEEKEWSWARFGIPLAAAAGIAFAFVSLREDSTQEVVSSETDEITIGAVEAGFVRAYESPIFSLDAHNDKTPVLFAGLREQGLPVADADLPPGLEHLKGLGCRELVVDGKHGTLVCFDTDKGALHLVTFRRRDVSCDLPGVDKPDVRLDGEWAMARWVDEKNAYTLIGRRSVGDLNRFF
ncbi:MAG: hypothetical protein NWT08_14810 [Akkermansiaceae bacterium]|jgi:hypothetical protein|nr:hypothetical protein [Akkermansiaceae bacterium]MDP4646622.1 hypothetical protein [Akkermansiaceae bacterium]MDP4720179.1 hypothetical protein [Akkermansiaceae bacterium]MDP4781614.1 hypothetical protein [Akkermansiaceae bacterium]MDP4846382.1 hypothetical protein [Akkermansiaceae bacterium]